MQGPSENHLTQQSYMTVFVESYVATDTIAPLTGVLPVNLIIISLQKW